MTRLFRYPSRRADGEHGLLVVRRQTGILKRDIGGVAHGVPFAIHIPPLLVSLVRHKEVCPCVQ